MPSTGRQNFNVDIKGLEAVENLGERLRAKQRPFLEAVAEDMRDRARKNLGARNQGGALARSIHVKVISDREALVDTNLVYARAQERGAFITPKRGQVLRFRATKGPNKGDLIYRSGPVRIKAKNYFLRAATSRRKVVNAAFDRVYDDLRDIG